MTVTDAFLEPPGTAVDPDALTAVKARDLVTWLRSGDAAYATFLESRSAAGPLAGDVVVFDVDVELPQERTNDIHRRERIAVTFDRDDRRTPEIVALRSDFPWVRHLNLRLDEYPRSLCVYEEAYADVRMEWTSVGFVERIRLWLARTAVDELHAPDQPLEAFLPSNGWSIVLPPDITSNTSVDLLQPLPVVSVRGDDHRHVLMTMHTGAVVDHTADAVPQVAVVVVGEPQPHGVISKLPSSLMDIHDFLGHAGIDLLGTLRERFRTWVLGGDRQVFDAHLIVIAVLPLTRNAEGATEATSLMAFLCDRTLRQVGAALGLWDATSPDLAFHFNPDLSGDGSDVPVMHLNTQVALSAAGAARLSGLTRADQRSVVAVGAGALGSQVFATLRRMGWGRWTLIDDDLFLPHNLARHELNANAIGVPKASALAWSTTHTLCDSPVQGINADLLDPRLQHATVEEALGAADVILDMSASIPVARSLAHNTSLGARRASLFLSPTGTDSVLLVEDAHRMAPLDWLEMQYYRALISQPEFENHLRDPQGRIQYAHTCRDVSSVIPQDMVALHAALTARELRLALDRSEAALAIFQSGDGDVAVRRHDFGATAAIDHDAGGWVVRTDESVLARIRATRAARLPNETGGVLIGAHDLERHIIYVVDLLPSPADSTEWPTAYIRGCAGLAAAVEGIGDITAQRLMYIGEWHSHPAGHGCAASDADRHAFRWLKDHMAQDQLPALMLIVGETDHAWYVQDIP